MDAALWTWPIRLMMMGNARYVERPVRAASTKVRAVGPVKDAQKSVVKEKTAGSKLDR